MEKRIFAGAAILLLLLQAACAPTAQVVGGGGPTLRQARSEPATGGKLRVAVMSFDNRTKYDVGQGMSAMLTSALFQTGQFIVLEREELSDVLLEQRLGATGVVDAETAAPSGEVEGAEILVYGTVTMFEPAQRGVVTAVGGAQQSQVAIDLKLIDSRTSRILGTTTVNGQATDVSVSTSGLKYAGLSPLFFMEAWNNTPIEGAIRLCIEEGVNYIVSTLEPVS
jgi:curli biogenesis system outer membrane secretion channel CsgG